MKIILAAHAGNYPRIGDKREQQKLRVVQETFDRGETAADELEAARNGVVRQVIDEQYRAKLDIVSDGLIGWHDSISHMVRNFKGVNIGGLLRYFDTNTYFRQPQVVSRLEGGAPIVVDEFKLARAVSPKPVSVTLTGPFTLSRLSLVKKGFYKSPDALMDDLLPLLAGEVKRLAEAGAEILVVDESFILREPGSLARLSDALEVLGGYKGEAKLWLRLGFGDASDLYDKLQRLAVDGLMLDFTYSPKLYETVRSGGSDLPLGLGLIDARNTRLESGAKVADAARILLRRVRTDSSLILCSNGLEYLPRQRAYEKLCLVARVRDYLTGKKEKAKGKAKGRVVRARKTRAEGPGRRAGAVSKRAVKRPKSGKSARKVLRTRGGGR